MSKPRQPQSVISEPLFNPKNTWHEYFLIEKLDQNAKILDKKQNLNRFKIYSFEDVIVQPNEIKNISTKLKVRLPSNSFGLTVNTKEMLQKNIEVLSCIVEKSEELTIWLKNNNLINYCINKDTLVGELVIHKHKDVECIEVKSISDLFKK